MDSVFVLCEDDDSFYGAFEMVGWFPDLESAQRDALAREWEHYRKRKAAELARYTVMSPDETEYRRFFIKEVKRLP